MKTSSSFPQNYTLSGYQPYLTSYQLNFSNQIPTWDMPTTDYGHPNTPDSDDLQIVKTNPANNEWMEGIRQTIMDNIENTDLNPSILSKMVCLSPSQLYRRIKAATAQTPIRFIRNARLKRAKELLSSTNFNISEIAYQVGFSDANYFSRTFHSEMGLSPSDFRKSI